MAVRWITARGYRVTLTLAVVFAVYHVVDELRVLGGGANSLVQRLELTARDTQLAFRGERTGQPWRVAVAAIDEAALQRFGPLPWDRAIHARLVDALTDMGAGAIAFDMTFDRPAVPDDSRRFERLQGAYQAQAMDKAPARLRRAAERLERTRRARRRGRRAAQRRAAAEVRKVADAVGRFDRAFNEMRRDRRHPDDVFAEAIAKSGRVVLGVVAYSKREAAAVEAIGVEVSGVQRVASSTVSSLTMDDGSGLTRIMDGRTHIQRGLYRRYFGLQAPTEKLAAATPHFGLINAAPDPDGTNRRMPLLSAVTGADVLVPSLALKTAEVALEGEIELVGDPSAPSADLVRIGLLDVVTEMGGTTTLDWLGRFEPDRFPVVSVVDILDGTVAGDQIRGRAVFVAATAVGTHDQRVTPLEPAVPGVYIHATLAQNILEGRQLNRPPSMVLLEMLLFILIGAVTGPIMARFRLWGQVSVAAGLAIGWLVVSQILFQRGLVVATMLPLILVFASLLAMSMWSYLVEQRERRKTRRAFGQYLSPAVLERVLAEPEEYLKLGGRRYDATVLFSDIRGFTTISEGLTPEELGRLLNEYMTPMTNIVFAHQGTLDKYIGDAVMAFWGAPVEQDDHPARACRAALEMQREVARLNQRFEQEGLPRIAIGIGLSTGPMTIGNMGSDDHFAYTALGDRVNLGARLESQTKEYGVGVMISEATYKRVETEMRCRELGSIRVKGRHEPVRIYELLGPLEETEDQQRFVDTFHRGLTLFQARKWDEAMAELTRARALRGAAGDRTSDLYIRWSMAYKENPPPPDWDGVHVATQK